MKKLVIAILCVLLVVGGILVFAFRNANWLISRYKGDLEHVLSSAVGEKVSIGEVEVRLFPDTRLKVAEITVGGSGGFSLRDLTLHLALMPLLRKQLVIRELVVTAPSIVLIRDADGVYLQGLKKKEKATPADSAVRPKIAPGERPTRAVPEVRLESVSVKDGDVILEDHIAGHNYTLSGATIEGRVDVQGNQVELAAPVVSGVLAGSHALVARSQKIGFNLESGLVDLGQLDITAGENTLTVRGTVNSREPGAAINASSRSISIARLTPLLEELAPTVAAYSLTGDLKPDMQVDVQGGSYKASGTIDAQEVGATFNQYKITDAAGSLSISADSATQVLRTGPLKFAVNKVPLEAEAEVAVSGGKATVRGLKLRALSGEANAKGVLDLEGERKLELSADAHGIDLAAAIRVFSPSSDTFSGTLKGLQAKIQGQAAGDVRSSLNGSGNFAVANGKLKGINIAGKALLAIDSLPFFKGSLETSGPPEIQKAIHSPDTNFSSISGDFSVSGGWIPLSNVRLTSDLYTITSEGKVSMDGDVDLAAQVVFSAAVGKALVQEGKDFRKVLEADGTLRVPLQIKGKGKSISVLPDVNEIMKRGAQKVIEQKAGELLDKAAKGKFGKGIGKLFGF